MALAIFFLSSLNGFSAVSDGALRMEVVSSYNLIVDGNAGTPSSHGPRSAYLGVKFYNDGAVPITDLIAHIGDYRGGVGDTPGVYPARVHLGLLGPLAGGAFAFTHEGGSAGMADATRYISVIPAGGAVTVYWLISYPQVDGNGTPTWGPSVKPDDDLWLEFDVWAKANENSVVRAVDVTRKMTMRKTIAASANKIFPNGANKVPDYYKNILAQYQPAWTNVAADGSVGTSITTEGIWYDLGNVGDGFDADGDLVPDRNIWMQPVGDPSLFDSSAFRLVKTYAMVVVKLLDGGEQVITAEDRLYFNDIQPNNGAVGYVRYDFIPLVSGARSVTSPYQAVASGGDTEKYNADYGITLGGALVSGEAKVLMDKTAVATISPGVDIGYSIAFTNAGTVSAGDPATGVPLVIRDSVPAGTVYVAGSATANNTRPPGAANYHVFYSTDGGATWSDTQPSPASLVTDIQWWLDDPLQASAAGVIRFAVTVNSPYQSANPQIDNVAGLSFGNNTPFVTDSATTLVTGNNSVGDLVYADTGIGAGGYLGNGIQDGTELGISNITVWLYADLNTNGVTDVGEPLIVTAETDANGAYHFDNLSDGKYVVVVDAADPHLTHGYTVTTVSRYSVDLDSVRTNAASVSVPSADFGFAPALVLSKVRAGGVALIEGQNATYTLCVTNRLAGDGSGVTKPTKYRLWAKSGTTGTSNKAWDNPANAYGASEPDGQYATAPMAAAAEWVDLATMSIGPQLGNISSVKVVLPVRVTTPFDTSDSLGVSLYDNGAAIAGATFTTNANLLAAGTYEVAFDVTGARAWLWSHFAAGNTLSIHMISNGKPSAAGIVEVDAAALELTSTALSGGSSGTSTLDPVPLDDTFDPSRLQFVSAVPTPDSVTSAGGTGTLHWNNLGPVYAGGVRAVSATFKVLQPAGNVSAPLTNTASVTAAAFLNGRPANADVKRVVDAVLPSGTIGDFVWRDFNTNGVQNVGEPGISGVTVSLYTNSTVLVAAAVTDAAGKYLFEGLTVSNTYTVTVDTTTLPGGGGTCTKDRDATPNSTTVFALAVAATNGSDTVIDADFGYNLQSLIRGTIWHDRDRDGFSAPEAGDELLGGVTVRLYAANGTTLLATTNTAADGTYRFVGAQVTNGSYVVKADAAAAPLGSAWTQSYDTDNVGSANQATVSLAPGSVTIADFSYYLAGFTEVGDTLFYDWNGNGAKDAVTDTGIANITVRLYQDENTNGVVDASVDALVAETVTSTNGIYGFTGLPTGSYLVVVDQADTNFTSRFLNTYDPQGAKDGRSVVTLDTSTTNLLQDFGYQPYGFNAIGDTVWFDANADGTQSGVTEKGLANVTVSLYADPSGIGSYTLVRTATTDSSGSYLFGSLPDGTYRVTVDTNSAALPKDSFGKVYRPTTVFLRTVQVGGGQTYLTADFGFAPLGAIGDTIFWDNNANGGQDWTEPGISNVTVRLYLDANANRIYDAGETLVATEVTGANGNYLFSGLAQGRYVVVVDSNSAALAGATLRADPEMDGLPCPTPPVTGPTCDGETGVSVLPGTAFMGADFGFQPTGVIGDQLWIDLNTNGVFDAAELGIPYVTVALYSGSTLVATNVTDADGCYSFGNLTNGIYRVQVLTADSDFPASVTASCDADGTADSVASNIVVSAGHVISVGGHSVANADLAIDFGYRYSGSNRLSGTVGLDTPTYDGLLNGTNSNGVGAGEYPFSGATAYLYLWHDANTNSAVNTGEATLIASTVTAANGDYSFGSLPAGAGGDRYIVSLAAPAGDLVMTTKTGDSASVLWVVNTTNVIGVSLSAYQVVPVASSVENVDFAYRTTQLLDYGDLPESYSTVVGNQPNGASHAMITNQNLWLGGGVSAELNGKPSATATGDTYDDGVVALGRWKDGVASGAVLVTVGAGSGWLEAWIDFNRDGTFTNANEHVISQSVSSATNGGVFSLGFDIPSGTFVTNGVTALNARFRLYPSQPELATYFGPAVGGEVEDYQFTFGIIGNRVWDDLNANGLQDAGEPGYSNVTVRLYDAGSALYASTTSSEDGSYIFTGLPTNTYSVVFEKPAGVFFTRAGVGGDTQLDSNAEGAGSAGTVNLSAQADRRDVDAGLYMPAVVEGYLFLDRNGDLLRNTNDSSVTNALVRLVVEGAGVVSTVTDAYGYYRFESVTPGIVTVLVSRASSTLALVPTQEPSASNPTRNRAVPDAAGVDGVIAFNVVSGFGVPGSGRPGETLNAGFSFTSLSTAIDFWAYASGRAGVKMDIWTQNESGCDAIVVYAWIGNAWVKVGSVPSDEIVGEGSNKYTIKANVLSPDGTYFFRIVDEAGHVHDSLEPVGVAQVKLNALRFEMDTAVLAFDTEQGRTYVVKMSDNILAPADAWAVEFVSVQASAGWSAYSDKPFMAGPGTQTSVRIPVKRKKAFFKIEQVDE